MDKKALDTFLSQNMPEKIAIAVSGGADSMGVVYYMKEWAQHNWRTIHALIVDHAIRKESAQEAKAVSTWLNHANIANTILVWKDGSSATKDIQNKARNARFGLMCAWCKKHNYPALVMAHHQNDQLETILMRLSKATDLSGLCGMRSVALYEGIHIIRPFLNFPPAFLHQFLKGRPHIQDPSNDNMLFERVRYRKVLCHLKEAGFDVEKFSKTIEKIQETDEFLKAITDKTLDDMIVFQNDTTIILEDRNLPFPLFKRVFEKLLKKTLRHKSIKNLFDNMQSPDFSGATLAGFVISRAHGKISIRAENFD